MTDSNAAAQAPEPETITIDAGELGKYLFSLVDECEALIPAISAGALEHEDILIDPILAAAFDADQEEAGDGDTLLLQPPLNEQVVLTAALGSAVGAVTHFVRGDAQGGELVDHLNKEAIEAMFAQQYKAERVYETESLYRMIVPDAGESWPDGCPVWLNVWFDVFASVVVSLKGRVTEARRELRNRVAYVQEGVRNARRLAQSDLKREEKVAARKERLRKMTARRKKAEAEKRAQTEAAEKQPPAAAATKPAKKPAAKPAK